ncbi:MAG: VacB/RNase II family 3'-5' exoribonuclease, partial [Lachnospiraceae bacterium]|nr:VacB/RNase II family 3'-5' exoribonuclease [Lachnospiraceae bacterium]
MEKGSLEKRKKTIYGLICDDLYVPMKAKEIAILLDIPKEQRAELEEVLEALVLDGKVEVSKKGKYSKAKNHFITGIFESNPRGFGFLRVEGQEEDIYIPESETGYAMHQDMVQVKLLPGVRGKRKEGTVVKILEHGITQVVGYYEQNKNFGFVLPDNQKIQSDIFIAKEHSGGAVTGHKVVCEIINYGKEGKKPEGKVIEILGHVNDPGVDILSIVKAYDLPVEFSKGVLKQVERIPDEVSLSDMEGRLDLREWQTVTIDGEDAKDLDDAITLTEKDGVYTLGVHIADVANYVQEYSALDEEAKNRGTSVYLVDRVIPMLPHKLSNGICSLNQGENRLALSCIMEIDETGKVQDHRIAETLIKVDRRMSYTSVKKILQERDEQEREKYKDFVPMFERMEQLASILRKKRMKRGSIDFDFPETKITLDQKGKPLDIGPYDRNVATKIIEDFMLIAN